MDAGRAPPLQIAVAPQQPCLQRAVLEHGGSAVIHQGDIGDLDQAQVMNVGELVQPLDRTVWMTRFSMVRRGRARRFRRR
jgi:hypothetical protein